MNDFYDKAIVKYHNALSIAIFDNVLDLNTLDSQMIENDIADDLNIRTSVSLDCENEILHVNLDEFHGVCALLKRSRCRFTIEGNRKEQKYRISFYFDEIRAPDMPEPAFSILH